MVSALASFLAGMAGVVGGAFLTLYPGAEWEILVYALVVVIVGGLGSLEGAMIGALIVGLLDAYGRWLCRSSPTSCCSARWRCCCCSGRAASSAGLDRMQVDHTASSSPSSRSPRRSLAPFASARSGWRC